jgi:7-carboxy-7-deazaguanine synthase
MAKEDTLVLHEIYASIQGESTWAGLRCTFVRTTGCNLRCSYCDTPQAFYGGTRVRRADVLTRALSFDTPLVEVTGGEPLLQPGVIPLMRELCDAGRTVLLETSGERDIAAVDPRVHRIVDFKTPDSGESHRNRWANVPLLGPRDEVKFVLCSEGDYRWMRETVRERGLASRVKSVLVSTAFGRLAARDVVAWVLRDRLDVRVQLQLHKYIWTPDAQGV